MRDSDESQVAGLTSGSGAHRPALPAAIGLLICAALVAWTVWRGCRLDAVLVLLGAGIAYGLSTAKSGPPPGKSQAAAR